MLKTIEVIDNVRYILPRIPNEMESEPADFFVSKCDLYIVMSGYLWQHLLQRDVVIDDGPHGGGITGKRIGRGCCDWACHTFRNFSLWSILLLNLPDDMDGCKGKARDKEHTYEGGCHSAMPLCYAKNFHPAKVVLFRLKFFVKALPGGIHIDRLSVLAMAAATFGFYHEAVGFARIFITVDDVLDFLLGVCIGIVEHFQ